MAGSHMMIDQKTSLITKTLIFGSDYFEELQDVMCEEPIRRWEEQYVDEQTLQQEMAFCAEYHKILIGYEILWGPSIWRSAYYPFDTPRRLVSSHQ